MNFKKELENLQKVVIQCHKCPRLVAYLKEVSRNKPKRFRDCDYWGRPLPSFGDPTARFLIIGLAPGSQIGEQDRRSLRETGVENGCLVLFIDLALPISRIRRGETMISL